ncbi:3'-5' exoribonuclease [Corynebacterium aquatimens]|uniref:exonuclease domain-containing protein n=1 Tax=Corynebacterium aquatimens TaxID=1190508 RepID=UPI0025423A95|nr:exonuclease domain-containing protein [Corynebacterium aquatimens]QYH19509.1 3'-5' exoribonuclease [Corynebacterium aquatimens]
MISAHGAQVTVTNEEITVTPTPLAASLAGSSAARSLAIAGVRSVTATPGDAWTPAAVAIDAGAGTVTITFPPGDASGPEDLAALITEAMQGEAPDVAPLDGHAGIPGFSFVALDVETANQHWGSICQIGMVKIVDGEEVERVSWLCTPPAGIDEFDPYNVAIHGITSEKVADSPNVGDLIDGVSDFVGDLPLVAHNAQFDVTALRNACVATRRPIPRMMFACTLAQSRATALDVLNHRLPTLAEFFEVALDNHHDAAADAAACAGIMVGLARRAAHEGSLMSFVHNTGFALGSLDDVRVTPVLRDRSGATRAMQAKRVAEAGLLAAVGAVATPQGSNQSGPSDAGERPREQRAAAPRNQAQRNQAPWQAVATPDTIPDPNPEADPDSPLYGQNVTLTGDFEPYDKGELWNGIAHHGGTVGKNVTKKTTILVAGEWATMTTKEKRARELQEKGQEIEIWPASKLFAVLGLAAE